jgi:hypothetical protein
MESEHSKSDGFRCRHCGREDVQWELLDVLEALCAKAGPLKETSALRFSLHPVEVRKPKPGFHARGLAADLVLLAMRLQSFYRVVQAEPRINGIAVDHTAGYIHVDVREAVTQELWTYRNGPAVLTTAPFREVAHG